MCTTFRFSIYCFNSANGEYGQYLLWKHFKRHRQSSRLSHWGMIIIMHRIQNTEFRIQKNTGAWSLLCCCTEYRKLWIHNTEFRIQKNTGGMIIIIIHLHRIQNSEFRIQSTAKLHDDHYAVVQKTEFGDNGVGLSHQASLHSESLESFCWQLK